MNLSSEWQEAIERVTSEDLHRVCAGWLSSPNVTEVSLDPLGSNAEEVPAGSEETDAVLSELVLPNGLKVVVREDHRLPLAYACLVFKAGCPAENERNAGVTDLMSECLLKGTTTRSAADIARFLEDIGGAINTSTGNNSLSVGCQTLAEDLDAALELMADVVMNPSFPEDAFFKEKETFVADAEEDMEDPLSVAFRQERHVAYGNVSYGNSPAGTAQSLSSLTVEDIRKQYERIICASNAVLCISGDVMKDKVLPLLEKHMGAMRKGSPPVLAPTPALKSGREVTVLDKQQAVLVVGVPGVDVVSPDMAMALIFQAWCGDMAGPVFTNIREEAGLAYYASSSLFIGMDAGGICFYLGTSPEHLEEAERRLEETLSMIYEQGMTEEELERTKASALSSRLLAMQSNGTLCQMLALDILFGLPLDAFEKQTPGHQEHDRGAGEWLYQKDSGPVTAPFLVHRASGESVNERHLPWFCGIGFRKRKPFFCYGWRFSRNMEERNIRSGHEKSRPSFRRNGLKMGFPCFNQFPCGPADGRLLPWPGCGSSCLRRRGPAA